ncbi:MAG: flagellar protein FliO/FliZ [Clostridiales bacterium]|nr:flagellar protein FliO/FliZ [Clostridiales bacterium]MDN5281362.1 flagellar protein FliO/FliZ [Candidatus Ozemobacter sp.]
MILFLISVCSAHAQPVASEGNGFLASEPLFLDQPVASSLPFLPNSDPFSTSLRILSALFAVIIIAFALSWFIQKKGGFNNNVFGKVIGVLPLDNKRIIYLVDVVGRILILGVTDSNINLLCEITDKDTIDSLRLQGQTPTMPGMEKIFSFLKNNKTDESADQPEINETDIKTSTSKNHERLRKINSLLVKRNSTENKPEDN